MDFFAEWIRQANYFSEDSVWSLLFLAALSAIFTVLIKIALGAVSKVLRKMAQKTAVVWDDLAIDIFRTDYFYCYFGSSWPK